MCCEIMDIHALKFEKKSIKDCKAIYYLILNKSYKEAKDYEKIEALSRLK